MRSEDVLAQPEAMLRLMCDVAGMCWDAAMLAWEAGAKPFDGCWAPWWYKTAHASTGAMRGLFLCC